MTADRSTAELLEEARAKFSEYMEAKRLKNPGPLLMVERRLISRNEIAQLKLTESSMALTLDIIEEYFEDHKNLASGKNQDKQSWVKRFVLQGGLLLLSGRCGKLTKHQRLLLTKQLGSRGFRMAQEMARGMCEDYELYVGPHMLDTTRIWSNGG